MEQQSQKFLRKRKSLLVLPLLVIPFLTIGFWGVGGGNGNENQPAAVSGGLNRSLPNPKLKDDRSMNKLSFYELAQKDSLRLKQAMEKERFGLGNQADSNKFGLHALKSIANNYSNRYHQEGLTIDDGSPGGDGVPRSKMAEQNLMKKLSSLEEEINKPSGDNNDYNNRTRLNNYRSNSIANPDLDRLEKMMHVMKDSGGDNSEVKQLDTVLEKILDLQYPERVIGKLKEQKLQSDKTALVVKQANKTPVISVLTTAQSTAVPSARFYGLNDHVRLDTNVQNAIEAVVAETRTLVDGEVVSLRLVNDITINGKLIPKDHALFGMAKLNGERLEITIPSITYDNSIYLVKLDVYDLDGLAGIYIPGAITRDVAKKSAGSSIQGMSYASLNPSLAAQAATAGVNAAKDLFSKKVKMVRVTVKAGYKVLLKVSSN